MDETGSPTRSERGKNMDRQFLVAKNPTLNGEKIEFPHRFYHEWEADTEYVRGNQVALLDSTMIRTRFFLCVSDHTSVTDGLRCPEGDLIGTQMAHWLEVPAGNVPQLSEPEYDSIEKRVTAHIAVDEFTQMLFIPGVYMGLDIYENGLPKAGTKRPKVTIPVAVIKGIWVHVYETDYCSEKDVPYRKVTFEVKGNVFFTEE